MWQSEYITKECINLALYRCWHTIMRKTVRDKWDGGERYSNQEYYKGKVSSKKPNQPTTKSPSYLNLGQAAATRKQAGIQQIYMGEGLKKKKKVLFVLLKKSILTSTNKLKQGKGSLGRTPRNQVYLAAATYPKRSHECWNSFKQEWTTCCKIYDKNNTPWAKKGSKQGKNTASSSMLAPTQMHTTSVSTLCSSRTCLGPSHNRALLPVSQSAGTRPKTVKAALLLQCWWPTGRF